MKISDRFTDYGLIGGFFWMLQLAIWPVIDRTGWADALHYFTGALVSVPKEALPSFVALLGAFGLIAVFTTGLLLDLLGSSYFLATEMMVFARHVRQHIHWLQRVTDLNTDYIQEDWSILINAPTYRNQLRASLKFFKLWNERDRKGCWLVVREVWKLRSAYTRMQSFLLSYVLLTSGVEKVELLSTQMSLWNTGRAIAAGIIISSVLIGSAQFVFGVEALLPVYGWILGCQLLSLILGLSVAHAAYERVCNTLFALVYVISERELRIAMSASAVTPAVLPPASMEPASDKQAAGE
jgi:hypothetical protein